MKRRSIDVVLILWALAFLLSGVTQLGFPDFVADLANWGRSAGWQREIALWNFGLLAVIVGTLARENEEAKLNVTRALVLLSLGLALNHAVELSQGGTTDLHSAAMIGNLVLCSAGVLALVATRNERLAASRPSDASR